MEVSLSVQAGNELSHTSTQLNRRKRHLKHQAVTKVLILTTSSIALGSLQFGYNIGVTNSPEMLIKDFINTTYYDRHGSKMSPEVTRNLWAVTVSIFAVGGCIGGFLAGHWANYFGRKYGCLVNVLLGILGAGLMYFSRRCAAYEMLTVGRFFIGIHCGLYTGLCPMYLYEISPAEIRGGVGVVHQLAIVSGLLLSQILSFSELLGTDSTWDLLLGLAIIPCLLQALLLPFCPESPKYLYIMKHDEQRCRRALSILRSSIVVEKEMEEIKQEMITLENKQQVSIVQLFRVSTTRRATIVGMVMQLSQQLSGINGVFFYSTSLFLDIGLTSTSARYATSAVGATMVIMTALTVPLMDRAGRRTLHLIGLGGMTILGVMITLALSLKHILYWINNVTVILMLLFVVFFAIGPGSVPWLIVSELFSQDARSSAISLCVLINWMSSFAVGITFQIIQAGLKDFTFVPFTVFLVIFFIFTYRNVPETKGKTLSEIRDFFHQQSNAITGNKVGNITNCQFNGTSENIDTRRKIR